jgi:hypothetical protein
MEARGRFRISLKCDQIIPAGCRQKRKKRRYGGTFSELQDLFLNTVRKQKISLTIFLSTV